MGKQKELEGFERPFSKRIEAAMAILNDKRKAKTRAGNAHKEAETNAIAVMREEKVTEYTSEDLGLTITLDDVEKAKLATWNPPKPLKAEAEA